MRAPCATDASPQSFPDQPRQDQHPAARALLVLIVEPPHRGQPVWARQREAARPSVGAWERGAPAEGRRRARRARGEARMAVPRGRRPRGPTRLRGHLRLLHSRFRVYVWADAHSDPPAPTACSAARSRTSRPHPSPRASLRSKARLYCAPCGSDRRRPC